MSKPINCPNCGEYLGSIGNLENCPICGFRLIEEEQE